jgi:hypothetical protein
LANRIGRLRLALIASGGYEPVLVFKFLITRSYFCKYYKKVHYKKKFAGSRACCFYACTACVNSSDTCLTETSSAEAVRSGSLAIRTAGVDVETARTALPALQRTAGWCHAAISRVPATARSVLGRRARTVRLLARACTGNRESPGALLQYCPLPLCPLA